MQADLTGLPAEKPRVTEAAVLGAAMLAAVGAGDYQSLAESSAALYRKQAVFSPDSSRGELYAEPYRRYRACWERLYGRPG